MSAGDAFLAAAGKMVITGDIATLKQRIFATSAVPPLWGRIVVYFRPDVWQLFNVVIYRLPLMMEQEESARFNLCVPASFLLRQCQRPIIWQDNIPLLSYLCKVRRAPRCCQ